MQSLNQPERVGLWVACEGSNRFLDSQAGIERLMNLILKKRVTDVFLQVFRGGRAWFPSKIFESGCRNSKLIELLNELNGRNIMAHAWINVCNASTSTSRQFIDRLGREARLLDGQGRDTLSDLSPYQIDTPGLWIEPSNPLLHSTMTALVEELNQLNFSGLHLDFIRYPYTLPSKPASWIDCGIDFGYSDSALERFKASLNTEIVFAESKINGSVPDSEISGQIFDNWRRTQIQNLVQTFRQALTDDRELSVAALSWSDRAYLNAYQDWRNWLELGLIDSLCLMTYTADNLLFTEQVKQAKAFLHEHQSLFAGIGLYKFSSDIEVAEQLKLAEKLEVSPCYFCADRLSQAPFDH